MNKKYRSRRFLIVVWTMLLLTIATSYALYAQLDMPWLGGFLTVLAGTSGVYIAGDSYTNGRGGGDA